MKTITADGRPVLLYKSFILLECLIWGVGNAVTKIGLESISPFYCLAIRFTLSFLILFLFFGKNLKAELTRRQLPSLFVIGTFTASSFICSTVAIRYTEATTAGFLMGISVVFTPFLSWFVLHKKPCKWLAPVIIVVIAGMYLFCGNSGSFRFGLGELLALSSSFSLAVMLTFSSKSVESLGPMTLATAQSGFSAVVCLVLALLFEDYHALSHVAASGWAVTLYLAIACTCIAYALQNYALKNVTPVFASLAFCTEPIFTAAASFLLLGEVLTLKGLLGGVLIIAGIIGASLLPTEEALVEQLIEQAEEAELAEQELMSRRSD